MDAPPKTEMTCYRHPDRRAGVTCQRCDRPICPNCMHTASVGFHCPECTKTGKQKVYTRANWSDALHRPVVTTALIAINVAVLVAGLVFDEPDVFSNLTRFELEGGLFGPAVADGEWYRIITSGFLHAGFIHLLFNMLALYSLGQMLEPAFGRLRFAAIYGASLLCGSLGVLLLSPRELTVGASGAVFGLMGALVIAHRARGIDPWTSGVAGVIGINLLITFTIPHISIGGHIGGLVGGFLAAWILVDLGPRAFRPKWAPVAAVVVLGVAAFVGCLIVAAGL